MFAYRGQFLRVDLTAGRVETLPTDPDWVREYLGGVGVGARILYNETSPEIDPLGPENVLVAWTGPFTATRVPSSGRR